MYNLIFFGGSLFISCGSEKKDIRVKWENDRAVAISIPEEIISKIHDDPGKVLQVRLISHDTPAAMFGEFSREGDEIIFRPLIPFTRGMRYEIMEGERKIGEIAIPVSTDRPELLAIYPQADTVPANLLKVYLRFSHSMREGNSLDFITVIKNSSDTVEGTFLDLDPELWNEDRTMLTLWLDPGRIKTGLHPNLDRGLPLIEGQRYTLVVSGRWTNDAGAQLVNSATRQFYAGARDSTIPDPRRWSITSHASPDERIEIDFHEPMDYSLILNAIQLLRGGKPIAGTWHAGPAEKSAVFRSDTTLEPGQYMLLVETRLEDLAGNNLIRPFERDIMARQVTDTTARITIPFIVK